MKNKKFFFTVALVCMLNITAVSFCAYLFFMLQKESGKILDARKQITVYEKRIESRANAKNNTDELTAYKTKIDSIFLNEENIVVLIEKLEQMASQAGVVLNLGGISMKADGGGDTPVVQLSVRGDFRKIYHYLALVENLPYYTSVDKFVFEKEDEGLWCSNFELTVKSFRKI